LKNDLKLSQAPKIKYGMRRRIPYPIIVQTTCHAIMYSGLNGKETQKLMSPTHFDHQSNSKRMGL